MINIKELRIGSIIVDTTDNSILRISSVNDEGYVLANSSTKLTTKLRIEDIEPLYLKRDLLYQIADHGVLMRNPRKENQFYFPNKPSTYFLVHDKKEDNYFIGMTDVSLHEEYRRITRPFIEYHKFQNAHKVIYDIELKDLNI